MHVDARLVLSSLPNANAKSQRFSYAISQIAPLPPVVALNRSSKSQIAARYSAFWHAVPKVVLIPSFEAPKSQCFESQRLQDADATKSQTLAFYKSQHFSATNKSRTCSNFRDGFVDHHRTRWGSELPTRSGNHDHKIAVAK